jgi:hypothetical protein
MPVDWNWENFNDDGENAHKNYSTPVLDQSPLEHKSLRLPVFYFNPDNRLSGEVAPLSDPFIPVW